MPPGLDEGNVRERPLSEIWRDPKAFAYNRCFDPRELSGDCARCEFGWLCRAGCTTVAYLATGSTGNNPYCLRRV
jgi:radical SAM protein with 4Fe4S-binding SPASM domain